MDTEDTESQQEQTTQNNQPQVEIKYSENLVNNVNYNEIDKDNELDSYHYSPDKQNYLLENKFIIDDEYSVPAISIADKDQYITTKGIARFYKFRNNKSLVNVQWLNNEEAIMLGYNYNIYIYNIKTKENNILILRGDTPEKKEYDQIEILSIDYNKKLNKLVSTISGDDYNTYTFDLETKYWDEVYETPNLGRGPISWLIKAVWDDNNNIYFDAAIDDHHQVIKKYNYTTKEITDFAMDSYLLNTSPDKNYITYVDKEKKVTVISDPDKNINIEIPMSEELTWKSDTEFASVEDDKYVNVYHIDADKDTVNVDKYDVSNLVKDEEQIYNVQFVNDKIRYNILSLRYNKKTDYVDGFSSLSTYEIESK